MIKFEIKGNEKDLFEIREKVPTESKSGSILYLPKSWAGHRCLIVCLEEIIKVD